MEKSIQYWDTNCLSCHVFSLDSSRSQSPAAKRRIPSGRDPWWRGSGPHSSQSHGFLHLLLLVRRPVLLPAVNSTQEAAFTRRRKSTPAFWKGIRYWGQRTSAWWNRPSSYHTAEERSRLPAAMSLISSASRFPSRLPETSLITALCFCYFNTQLYSIKGQNNIEAHVRIRMISALPHL